MASSICSVVMSRSLVSPELTAFASVRGMSCIGLRSTDLDDPASVLELLKSTSNSQ